MVRAAAAFFGLDCADATTAADCPAAATAAPAAAAAAGSGADDAWDVFGSDDSDDDSDGGGDEAPGLVSVPSAAGAVLVHTADAERFVRQRLAAMAAAGPAAAAALQYDVVIVDVFTQGTFPPPLLAAQFWQQLRGVRRAPPCPLPSCPCPFPAPSPA